MQLPIIGCGFWYFLICWICIATENEVFLCFHFYTSGSMGIFGWKALAIHDCHCHFHIYINSVFQVTPTLLGTFVEMLNNISSVLSFVVHCKFFKDKLSSLVGHVLTVPWPFSYRQWERVPRVITTSQEIGSSEQWIMASFCFSWRIGINAGSFLNVWWAAITSSGWGDSTLIRSCEAAYKSRYLAISMALLCSLFIQ